ncbi:peptide deformylase [Rhodobacterales bacterium 59_46_T64]|nr:peptide deformylase [Rhodobacterales bacterium 59_46_T64]
MREDNNTEAESAKAEAARPHVLADVMRMLDGLRKQGGTVPLPVLKWPDARLSKRCEAAELTAGERAPDGVVALALGMLHTMYAAEGRGLAAPQVGVLTRIFVMDCTWKEGAYSPVVCLNPEVLDASRAVSVMEEGCLSIPGVSAPVSRPDEITLAYTDLDGVHVVRRLTGFEARCAQHELDHLDGLVTFDRLDAARREKIEAVYTVSNAPLLAAPPPTFLPKAEE